MTVHGAKGLEAQHCHPRRHHDAAGPGHASQRSAAACQRRDAARRGPARGDDVGAMARRAREHGASGGARRISPAALCGDDARRRAADRLRLRKASSRIPDGCWYQLVEDALTPRLRERAGGRRRRRGAAFPQSRSSRTRRTRKPVLAAGASKRRCRRWLDRRCGSRARVAARTHHAFERHGRRGRRCADGQRWRNALLRGSLVHRLLQSLPDIRHRRGGGRRRDDYLARAGGRLAAEERVKLAEQVMLVLDDTRFAPAVRARQPRRSADRRPTGGPRRPNVLVSGQIDRLAVTQDAVLIADFKTNRARRDESPRCRPAYVRSSRFTAPCSRKYTRTGQSAPR